METTTTKGTKVTLTPTTQHVFPTIVGVVHVQLTSSAGPVDFVSRKWRKRDGGTGILGESVIIGGKFRTIVVSVPEADYLAVLAEAKTLADAERREAEDEAAQTKARILAACPAGYEIAKQLWANGDLCAAEYLTEDGTKVLWADLQPNQGDGWYYIPTAEADKARAEVAAKAAAKAVEEQAEVEHLAAVTAEAKATGKDALLAQWAEDCDDPREECNVDRCYRWVRPDGSQYTTRNHTW